MHRTFASGWGACAWGSALVGLVLAVGHPAAADPAARSVQDLIEGNGIYGLPPAAPAGVPPGDPSAGSVPVDPSGPPSDSVPTEVAPPLQPVSVEWRLANPFRFFTDPADTEMHRATYLALSPDQRANSPVLAAERALSRRHDDGWAATVVAKTCWNMSKNRHICPEEGDYINPESHEVIVTLAGVADTSVDCTWLTAPLGGTSARGVVVTKPCREPIKLEVPYPAGLSLKVEVGGLEVAATDIKVRDILVVALGDSFGSGEGNPDIPVRFSPERAITYGKAGKNRDTSGYPARVGPWKQVGDEAFIEENARWLDQACHRSLYSYSARAALQLAIEDPHRAVTYVGLACSGAEVTFGLFLRYKGNEWVPKPPDLSQISAAADAQCGTGQAPLHDLPEAYHINGSIPELQGGLTLKKCPIDMARKIDLVLLSIGGNDIGFARLVADAVLADKSLIRSLGGWFGQVHGNRESEELLGRLDKRYKAMNRALHGILHVPWDQADRVMLTSYPPFALLDDKGTVCSDGNAGMDVFEEFAITERSALSSAWLADKLDQVMKSSARAHRWTYIDAHRKAFVGHGLCAGHTDGTGSLADDLRMPRRKADRWVPYNPAHFQAYGQRERWFRTPNDAFLTGNFHVAGSVMQKVLKLESFSWFQVLLASTYSGAFHPSAEGHAAIADAVVAKARGVLAKYGQGSRTASVRDLSATP